MTVVWVRNLRRGKIGLLIRLEAVTKKKISDTQQLILSMSLADNNKSIV